MKNLLHIFNKLNITQENGLFITSENVWKNECQFSSRIDRLIGSTLKPDAFFVFDNKPLILFYDSPQETAGIHKALWNFNESPIVIFAYNGKIEVFNGFNYLVEKASLQFIGNETCLNDFNYYEIVSGKTWGKYQEELHYDKRVDYRLLKNIEQARGILVEKNKLEAIIANALIGKVIFVRYLIDRKVRIGYDGNNRCWTNDDFCKILSKKEDAINFFKYLEGKFNGDMFFLKDDEYLCITDTSFNTIISLLNEVDMGNGQMSLFMLYDFAIIPIEFISNVYESFIGNQEEDSAYYTPLFLVDYILTETVDSYFKKNPTEYNCKVLDPACGSGIFLVEALRKLIEQYILLNPHVERDSSEFKEAIKQLAVDNIFGIDKNLSAIQVAIFSLQLTLLDYQKPSSIETFRFPKLLHTNFFCADFFDTEHVFNASLKSKKLDFILGNPPWKRGKGGKLPLFVKYINERNKREKKERSKDDNQITISNNEIAQAFLLRVSDFSIDNSVALIVTSKVLYNLNGKDFRKYFLDNFLIHKVFELAPVRHDVFDKSKDPSIAPAAILFYKPALHQDTNENIIEHISLKPSRFFKLFKIFSLYRSDIKEIQQIKLKQYDWLWKTLVYGSYLDFNLINRLKSDYSSIEKELRVETRFLKGQGITIGGGDKNSASHLLGLTFINTNKRNIQPFWINLNVPDKWNLKLAHRPRNQELFKAPMLLLKKGVSNEYRMTSAVCETDAVYTDSLTAIKAYNQEDLPMLHVMSGIYNSSLFSYYALHSFSSIGVEREQVHDEEKIQIPYVFNSNIYKASKEIECCVKMSNDSNVKYQLIENEMDAGIKSLEVAILAGFNISEQEKTLIDYANNIVIPVQMQHAGFEKHFQSIRINDPNLESYAQLFIDRFSPSLNTGTQQFIVEIWHSNQIIGMFFKVVPKNANQQSIVWKNKAKEELLSIAIKLSSQKITDKLFIQKDLRGFEKDFFYLFKPNEKRLWHNAIGYQDVDEFMDAILKTNRRAYNG